MNDAIEKCSQISEDSLMECIGAVNTAHGEILQFLALNVKLEDLSMTLGIISIKNTCKSG